MFRKATLGNFFNAEPGKPCTMKRHHTFMLQVSNTVKEKFKVVAFVKNSEFSLKKLAN